MGTRTDPKVDPEGFESGLLNEARCHIVAAQLGGSNRDPLNFFWGEHDPFNTPDMSNIERIVAERAKKATTEHKTIIYQVRLQYADRDPTYGWKGYVYHTPMQLYFRAWEEGILFLKEGLCNPLGLRSDITHLLR
jgi:hypothetical protein